MESPFRIRPFIGAKIPRDSNYKTVLKLHNPEPEPMQIIQWYASTSRLQLEPIGNWLIEPFEDKIIGDMSFLGKDTTGLQVKFHNRNLCKNLERNLFSVKPFMTCLGGLCSIEVSPR